MSDRTCARPGGSRDLPPAVILLSPLPLPPLIPSKLRVLLIQHCCVVASTSAVANQLHRKPCAPNLVHLAGVFSGPLDTHIKCIFIHTSTTHKAFECIIIYISSPSSMQLLHLIFDVSHSVFCIVWKSPFSSWPLVSAGGTDRQVLAEGRS